MNESGTGSTFRELSAWASFFVLGGMLAWYAQRAIVAPTDIGWAIGLMIAMVVYVVVANIFFAIVFSFASPDEKDNARDKLIKSRSTRFSEWVIGFGVLATIALVFAQQVTWIPIYEAAYGTMDNPTDIDLATAITEAKESVWRHPMVVGHALVGTFIASEIVRYFTIGMDYRLSS